MDARPRGTARVRIGAAVTYAELASPPLADLVPALAQAARTVGSPQIRSAATVGGNLATCSPAGDGLPVLAALDAVVELRSADGVRTLPVDEFMVGVKRTARRPGELITAVTVPLLDGWQGYAKVGVRNAMVIAISGACLAVDRPTRSVRLALGSVAPTIVRAPEAEALAAGERRLGERRGRGRRRSTSSAGSPRRRARPIDDHRATAAYRRHSIEVLARRLLRRAFPRRRWRRSVLTVAARCTRWATVPLHVNGVDHDVADAWLGENLLYVLRERLGLYGSKGACEQGECGSCSVLVDGELVCSCLVLAASAVGQAIVTVEGIGDGEPTGALTDVQQAFVDDGAVQCGFCTPGLIVAVHDLLDRIPAPDQHPDRRGAVGQHLPLHRATAGSSTPCSGSARAAWSSGRGR